MAYILDAAVILILIVAILVGRKRGFAKTLVRVVGTMVALAVVASVSPKLASGIFDACIADTIKEDVVEALPTLSADTLESSVQKALDSLPSYVKTLMDGSETTLSKQIASEARHSEDNLTVAVADTIVRKVVRPVAVSLLTVVCFIVLLIVLIVLVCILAHLTDKFFQLPGLKGLNRVMGSILGVLQGILWVLVLVAIVQMISGNTRPEALLGSETLAQTKIVSWICEWNPLTRGWQGILAGMNGFLQQ